MLKRSRPGYMVRVDERWLGDSRFVIQAAVEYGEGLSEEQREEVKARAQLELLLAIEGAEERGRRLGADVVRVGVVGDEPLYRLFSGRTKAQPPKPASSRRAGLLGRGGQPGLAARPAQDV